MKKNCNSITSDYGIKSLIINNITVLCNPYGLKAELYFKIIRSKYDENNNYIAGINE
jgi:hypothetical protein